MAILNRDVATGRLINGAEMCIVAKPRFARFCRPYPTYPLRGVWATSWFQQITSRSTLASIWLGMPRREGTFPSVRGVWLARVRGAPAHGLAVQNLPFVTLALQCVLNFHPGIAAL